MTTALPSARPAWAVTMWADDTAIYVELPVKGGPPYITKFPLTEGGLSKALNLLHTRRVESHGGFTHDPAHPNVTYAWNRPGTPAQRATAHALLKKSGII